MGCTNQRCKLESSFFVNTITYYRINRFLRYTLYASKLGEIITLPIVVLVTVMAQPRLQFAMAQDGLLPPIFASIDDSGNLWHGTFISGALCVVVATCVPFVYLNDLISAGILLAFSMTDASVILLRQSSPEGRPFLLQKLLFAFNLISLMLGLLFQTGNESLTWQIVSGLHIFALFMISLIIGFSCPKIMKDEEEDFFEAPFVPYLPLVGQFLNCYLIGQLEIQGLLMLLGYTCLSIIFYFSYGAKHSFGNTIGWRGSEESCVSDSSTSVSESIGVAKHQEISLVGEHDSSNNIVEVEVDQHNTNTKDDDIDSSDNSGSINDGISIYSEKPLKM
jgi:amino acid transporter